LYQVFTSEHPKQGDQMRAGWEKLQFWPVHGRISETVGDDHGYY